MENLHMNTVLNSYNKRKGYNPQYNTHTHTHIFFYIYAEYIFDNLCSDIHISILAARRKSSREQIFYTFHSDFMKSTCGNNIAQRTHPCLLMLFLLSSSQQYLYNYCRDEPF